MASKSFSKEQLNFFKFSSLVLDEFPKALRQIFIKMWDTKIAAKPGGQVWDDSSAVRNMLLICEGGKTDIPTNNSIDEWDCTALFKATIYAKTFGGAGSTLNDLYLKKKKPAAGTFHVSVISPTGNQVETDALVIDQLRLLRNKLCHSPKPEILKADFDQYVLLAKDALSAVNVSTACIDVIGGLTEDDFPTERVNKLNECFINELQAISHFHEAVVDKISDIDGRTKEMHEMIKTIHISEKNYKSDSLPRSHVPGQVRYFVGRDDEVQKTTSLLTNRSTRLVNFWGCPGFGKTSTAIAVARHLQSLGHAVYFFKFQGVSSIEHFYSKILSIFNLANESIAPVDKLLSMFREVSCPVFLIFDNLDDLIASKSDDTADNVIDAIQEFLDCHENINILVTTRESLESLCSCICECESLRIRPLDDVSSIYFVRNFLPGMTEEVLTYVTKISGNVPLAMKLLANLIQNCSSEDAQRILGDIPVSSVLETIEDPYEKRLRKCFSSSFDRLLESDKEALVSLTVFRGGDIDVEAAVTVVGGDEVRARRSLITLVNKALIDQDSEGKYYSIHPLLYSFALEKGDLDELKTVAHSSFTRYFNYYLRLFEKLNEQVLTGKPLIFRGYKAYDNIDSILFGEFMKFLLRKKYVFDVLTKSELFLYSLYAGPSQIDRVNYLYNLAIEFAKKRNENSLYYKLIASKCFGSTTILSHWSPEILKVSESVRKEISLMTDGTAAKFSCYEGLYEISCGKMRSGVLRVEKSLSGLKSCADQQTLKCLCLQLLSLYYKFLPDNEKSKQFDHMAVEVSKKIGNPRLFFIANCESADDNLVEIPLHASKPFSRPSILLLLTLSLWATNVLTDENKNNLSSFIYKLQREAETELFDSSLLMRLLRSGDIALAYLSTKHKTMLDDVIHAIKSKLEITNVKDSLINLDLKSNVVCSLLNRLAECCFLKGTDCTNEPDLNRQALHDALEITRQLEGDQGTNTAQCYFFIGVNENVLQNHSLALEAHEQALKIRLSSNRKCSKDTGYSYMQVGKTQYHLGKLQDAIASYQSALDIWLKIEGKESYQVAKSYFKIGIVQRCLGHPVTSLQTHQRALKILLKIQGEVNKLVFKIYWEICVTQKCLCDYSAALASVQRALDIRKKMDGEESEWVAETYELVGHLQTLNKDYASSLESYNHARAVRTKIFGRQSQWVAQSYQSIGETQMKLGDISSSLESHQSALEIMLQLDEGKRPFTSSVFLAMGIAQCHLGDFAASIKSYQNALKIAEDTKFDRNVGACHFQIGIAQNHMGEYRSSVKSFERALQVGQRDCPSIPALIYNWIGRNYSSMQEYSKAVQSFQRSLDITSVPPQNQEMMAESYYWLANAQLADGKPKLTLKSLNEAIKSFKLLAKQHSLMIDCYCLTGIIQNSTGKHAMAINAFESMLHIYSKNDMKTADCHFQLASAQCKSGTFGEALASMYKALKISLDVNGKNNAVTAEYFCFIGTVAKKMGNKALALSNFQTAFDIRREIFGENHPETKKTLSEVQDVSLS